MGTSNSGSGNGGALLSGIAGALIGVAGVAWWLLSEAEGRRQRGAQARRQRPSLVPEKPSLDLHHKVHELNQAIEEVRRQLEGLATPGQ